MRHQVQKSPQSHVISLIQFFILNFILLAIDEQELHVSLAARPVN